MVGTIAFVRSCMVQHWSMAARDNAKCAEYQITFQTLKKI